MVRKSTLLFGGLLATALAPVTVGMLPLGGHATTSAATLAAAHAGHHAAAAPVPSGDDPFPQVIYYKTGVLDYTSVRPFPKGLRFVVGSPTATADQFMHNPGTVEGFECGNSYKNADFPPTCPAGTQLTRLTISLSRRRSGRVCASREGSRMFSRTFSAGTRLNA